MDGEPGGAALIAALLAVLAFADAGTSPVVVSVVVGANRSPGPETADLRYADDDAIQNARTLRVLGADAALLVTADDETRELFPDVRPDGRATREALNGALERAFTALRAARAAGRPTRFYFMFAGHGDVADDRPFLQMEDGRLWRDDLAHLLGRSPAQENHVVIDACHASLFVGSRGPGGERAPMAPGFSRAAGPRWPARTGLLTARSAGGQTHEWTEYQAGIFSHEVRSALLGAADANLDGRITYRELGAFVRRANESIASRKYRPEVVTAPPDGDADAVFATLPEGPLVLELDREVGRAFVQSERGVRVADLHPSPALRVRLRLPTDLGTLFIERPALGTEARIEPRPGRVLLSSLEPRPTRARARGAAHEAFLRLFSLPFDGGAVTAFRADEVALTASGPPSAVPRWAPWAVTAAGTGALALGIGFGTSAYMLAGEARAARGEDRPGYAPRIESRNQTARILGAVGLATVAAGLVWTWWMEKER